VVCLQVYAHTSNLYNCILSTLITRCDGSDEDTKVKLSSYTPLRHLGGQEVQLLLLLGLGIRQGVTGQCHPILNLPSAMEPWSPLEWRVGGPNPLSLPELNTPQLWSQRWKEVKQSMASPCFLQAIHLTTYLNKQSQNLPSRPRGSQRPFSSPLLLTMSLLNSFCFSSQSQQPPFFTSLCPHLPSTLELPLY
jgi:hypothetical protein